MPWFMYPALTRKVLNRLANKFRTLQLKDERQLLDAITQRLWDKIEAYYGRKSP